MNFQVLSFGQGLDGCGKSTQAKLLTSSIAGAKLRSTPPQSMKVVRECFDRHGGDVARAFYLVSNYVLAMEMIVECQKSKSRESKYDLQTQFTLNNEIFQLSSSTDSTPLLVPTRLVRIQQALWLTWTRS